MSSKSIPVLIDTNPGRSCQPYGIAREIGTDVELVHAPSIGVVGNKGDSQCYVGVQQKVEAIQECLRGRIGTNAGQIPMRLVQPEYTVATSDGMRNGTREMRYSLIGREVTHDTICEHLSASGLQGTIAVVACDKPPVGTLAAILEHNHPAIIMSDGPIRPGHDSLTGKRLDLVDGFQAAGSHDAEHKKRIAIEACPGYGSCGGMFTYNTMQIFIGVVGMQPLNMVAVPSDDPRRVDEFPDQLVNYLWNMIEKDIKPRDIVSRDSIRNATIVALAVGGSTNVVLHAPEIARAAGFANFWRDVMTPAEFNHLSQYMIPVLTDARPYGKYSMVDIDEKGGVQVIVKTLLEAGLLNGDTLTCTGETLAEQVARLDTPDPDGVVIWLSRWPASTRPIPTESSSTTLKSRTRIPAACASSAATCRPNSARCSSWPGLKVASMAMYFVALRGSSRVSRVCLMRSNRMRMVSGIMTWSSCATRDPAARRGCPRCSTRRRG